MNRIKIIVGAGGLSQADWLSTDIELLDIVRNKSWRTLLGKRQADALVAEHVWEHLDDGQTEMANANCFEFLVPGKQLRIAVPDGFFPDPAYIEWCRPGGSGPGATDHKVLYDHRTMTTRLEKAGFMVQLLEYWDENGEFHYTDWSSEEGHIVRSRRYDDRNFQGKLAYTSLIVDAIKPARF